MVDAVAHPLRVRILEVLNELDMSPSEFVDGGYADFFFGRRPNVNEVAYHFRTLAQFRCLVVVDSRESRGSIATTYRGSVRAEFIGTSWTDLSEEEKSDIVKTVSQGLIARIDGALMAETINARDDRQISWFAMQLDERGWNEATEILAAAYRAVKEIGKDADARLKESEEPGIASTAAILMFESPGPTPPAAGS
ncbi:MAG TPA: hypothetical protein VGC32_12880 [Solirubrobacterales bacterium]